MQGIYKNTHTAVRWLFFHGLVTLFIFCGTKAQGQHKQYNFNNPGNECFMEYILNPPNGVFESIKRPFVIVVGKQGETAAEALQRDSIWKEPAFHHYMFVYLPGIVARQTDRLRCIETLTSLLTYNYYYGHDNLFLKLCDSAITDSMLTEARLNMIFSAIRLPDALPSSVISSAAPESNLFKETAIDYENYHRRITDDGTGTFFVEEEQKTTNSEPVSDKAEKNYFGAPTRQHFTLSGMVRDKSTGEALPFATVMVKGTTNGTSANADGYFTLLKVPTDTSVLLAQYVGYQTIEVFLNPETAGRQLLVELPSQAISLRTVTVVGKRDDLVLSGRQEIATMKLSPKKLEQLPNTGERDVMRSFQLMPGVSASNESSSGLFIRGGTPDQNLVLYDGFSVYHVDHLYGFFSAFNSNALKDVQLYKGGFESKFGGRLSSVTEITGKDGNSKRFNIGGDLSMLSTNVFAELPIGKKFTSVVAFRKSYKGFLYNKIFDKFSSTSSYEVPEGGGGMGRFSQETEVTSYFYDLNAKFTYRPTDRDVVSLSIFNGADKLDNGSAFSAAGFGMQNARFGSSSTDLTNYGNTGGSLKWGRKWNEKIYGNTLLSYSNYFSERDRTQERTTYDDDGNATTVKNGVIENNDLKDYSLKSDYEWDAFRNSKIQFGLFASWYDIDYSYAQNDTTDVLQRSNEAALAGIYLQTKTRLFKDRLIVTPGLRTSYFGQTGKIYAEPRLSMKFHLTENLALNAATGQYYQFANRVTREDILSGSRDFWLLSDETAVPVSSASHYIAGLSFENNNYLFSAEAYYKDIQSLTEYSLRFDPSPMGVSYDENFFSGKGYAKGLELMAQKQSGKFNGWVAYTLGEAKNRFDIYGSDYFAANQDVRHEFKVVALYKFRRWDFSATWIYATGRPYTAPSGAYTITLLDGNTHDFFTVTDKNSQRLPDYHRADISATFKLLGGLKGDKKRREYGYIGASIFNLYDRKNVWYKQFMIEDGSIIETNVNYLGFMPNITLSLKLR